MDLSNSPFEPEAGEEVKFFESRIDLIIENSEGTRLSAEEGFLGITTTRVVWLNHGKEGGFYFRYQNCVSHGTDGAILLCFLKLGGIDASENNDGDSDEEHKAGPEGEVQKLVWTSLEKMINATAGGPTIKQISGDFCCYFNCAKQENPQDVTNNAYKQFQVCSELNPDEENGSSLLDEDDLEENEMITADDIDDDGNIKIPFQVNGPDDHSEDTEHSMLDEKDPMGGSEPVPVSIAELQHQPVQQGPLAGVFLQHNLDENPGISMAGGKPPMEIEK
jgi:hypothetical protein